ncbi:YesK family protein [Bacillus pumilus]|nr:YesK family protein [Bacillus pumilus]
MGGWEGLGLGAISVSLLIASVIALIITSILSYFSGMKQK